LPDFLLRGIDAAIADRIKTIARERNWALNDAILHLIQMGLGMIDETTGVDPDQPPAHRDIAMLGGTWAPDEAAAFRSALEAFESIEGDQPPWEAPAAKQRG
jgi:hypothetical protein